MALWNFISIADVFHDHLHTIPMGFPYISILFLWDFHDFPWIKTSTILWIHDDPMGLREGDVFGDRIGELHFAAVNQGQERTGHQWRRTAVEFAEAPLAQQKPTKPELKPSSLIHIYIYIYT